MRFTKSNNPTTPGTVRRGAGAPRRATSAEYEVLERARKRGRMGVKWAQRTIWFAMKGMVKNPLALKAAIDWMDRYGHPKQSGLQIQPKSDGEALLDRVNEALAEEARAAGLLAPPPSSNGKRS